MSDSLGTNPAYHKTNGQRQANGARSPLLEVIQRIWLWWTQLNSSIWRTELQLRSRIHLQQIHIQWYSIILHASQNKSSIFRPGTQRSQIPAYEEFPTVYAQGKPGQELPLCFLSRSLTTWLARKMLQNPAKAKNKKMRGKLWHTLSARVGKNPDLF